MISLHLTSGKDQVQSAAAGRILATDADHMMAPLELDRLSHFFFTLDEMPFDIHRVKRDGKDTVYIMAILGYLPFTAESAERRQMLLDIISAAQGLNFAKFVVDRENKLIAVGSFEGSTLTAPDFMFYPLMLFMQEIRPFIQLAGQYL